MDFLEKNVVVTCACSQVGYAAARKLSDSGASLYIADVDETLGRSIADELNSAGTSIIQHCSFIKLDTVEDCQDTNISADRLKEIEAVDIIVNTIGCDEQYSGNRIQSDEASFEVALERCKKANNSLLPLMQERDRGKVINIVRNRDFEEDVISYTRVCARDLAKYAISVNCICTGSVTSPQIIDEIADAVVFLATPASNHMSGQVLRITEDAHAAA